MDPILTSGRTILAADVEMRLQKYMTKYNTGIEIDKVNIKEASAPPQLQAAFDDVIKAQQDRERYTSEADAYANSVVPEARGKAQRMLEEANAYKEQVIAQAEGEADRFVKLHTEYRRAPRVTRERLYLDSISKVYGNTSKVMVDVEGGNNMMYLPLDKIMQNNNRTRMDSSGSSSDSTSDIDSITDRVVEELRQRQTTRREGR
jgi:membrane protease subunit HflK